MLNWKKYACSHTHTTCTRTHTHTHAHTHTHTHAHTRTHTHAQCLNWRVLRRRWPESTLRPQLTKSTACLQEMWVSQNLIQRLDSFLFSLSQYLLCFGWLIWVTIWSCWQLTWNSFAKTCISPPKSIFLPHNTHPHTLPLLSTLSLSSPQWTQSRMKMLWEWYVMSDGGTITHHT